RKCFDMGNNDCSSTKQFLTFLHRDPSTMRLTKSFALLSASALLFSAAAMHASPIVVGATETFTETPYSQSNNGECCFTVTLTQVSTTKIGVDVSLSKLNSG